MNKNQKPQINVNEFIQHRADWMKLAQASGWFQEPLHMDIFIDDDGTIMDSISNRDKSESCVYDMNENFIGLIELNLTIKNSENGN